MDTSISNVFMRITDYEFKKNQCSNSFGGAISLNVEQNLTIENSVYENNIATGYSGTIFISR